MRVSTEKKLSYTHRKNKTNSHIVFQIDIYIIGNRYVSILYIIHKTNIYEFRESFSRARYSLSMLHCYLCRFQISKPNIII